MDLTSRRNSLNFDLYNFQYTRGIDVQQVNKIFLEIFQLDSKYLINNI